MNYIKRLFIVISVLLLFTQSVVHAKKISKEKFFDTKIQRDVDVVENEIIVRFKDDATDEKIEKLHSQNKTKVSKVIKKLKVHRISIPSGKKIKDLIEVYKQDPDVFYVEPNFVAEGFSTTPNDTYFSQQWGLTKIYAPEGWDIEKGNSNVVIAIIDTGIDFTHPDLDEKIVNGYDFVNEDSDPTDNHGHGTHCAGIAAAESNNGQGITGVTWNCKLMPVKVLDETGSGVYSDVAEGIIYATDNGARIINLSLGAYSYSQTLQDAIDYAYQKDCVIVASAGNDNTNEPVYPAACSNVIGVGATGQNDERWQSSNYGNYIDVVSPGVNIYSTGLGSTYFSANGTSASAPFVSGLAGLILSQNNTLANYQVENKITQSADDLGNTGKDDYYGYGRINAKKSLQQNITPVHDISIVGLKVVPFIFNIGQSIKIIATVENQGMYNESEIIIAVYVNNSKIGDNLLTSIMSGERKNIEFDWAYSIPNNKGEIMIKCNVNPIQEETNIENNSKTTMLDYTKDEVKNIIIFHGTNVHTYITKESLDLWPNDTSNEINSYISWIKLGAGNCPNESDNYNCFSEDGCGIDCLTHGLLSGYSGQRDYFQDYYGDSGLYRADVASGEHFWDPNSDLDYIRYSFAGWPVYAQRNAYIRAKYIWDNYVVPNYPNSKSRSYYYFGRVIHLLEDMSVPAHTFWDDHGPTGGDDEYEDYIKNGAYSNWDYLDASGYQTYLSLYDLFYNLAERSDNYPSDDYDGESYYNNNGSLSTTNESNGELTATACNTIGNTLMPKSMEYVAGLLRYYAYTVDNTAPTTPTNVTDGVSGWSNDDTPTFSWSACSDNLSGLKGYYWSLTDSTPDSNDNFTINTSVTLPAQANDSYTFYVSAVDNATNPNYSNTSSHDFYIDDTVPDIVAVDAGPSSADRTSLTSDGWFNYADTGSDDKISFCWTDPNSPSNDTFYYEYNNNSGNTSIDGNDLSVTIPYVDNITVNETNRYFHLKPKNGAGKWGTEKVFCIKYDGTKPGEVSNLKSASHNTSSWSNDNTIDVTWTSATDSGGSGLDGYAISWTNGTENPTGKDIEENVTSRTSDPRSDANNWYFNIRSVDNAGNWCDTAKSVGPFYIDTTIPVSTCTILLQYQTSLSFIVQWSGTDSGGSELKNYDVQYKVGAGWTDWITTTTLTAKTFGPISPVTVQDGQTYYFRVRAKDNAGNIETYPASADTSTTVDISSPPAPTISSATHPEGVWSENKNPSFSWTEPSDISGISEYCYALNHLESYAPDPNIDSKLPGGTTFYVKTDIGDGIWYFHIRAKDNAGWWGDTDTYGPVKIDTVYPTILSVTSSKNPAKAGDTIITVVASEQMILVITMVTQNQGTPKTVVMSSSNWITWIGTYTVVSGYDGTAIIYVSGKDLAEKSSIGLSSSTFVVDTTSPTKPKIFSYHPEGHPFSNSSPSFSWTSSTDSLSGLAGYSYAFSEIENYDLDTTTETVGTSVSFTKPDGTYWFHLRAVDNAGNGSEIDRYKVILNTVPPNAPSDLLATPLPGRKICLDWVRSTSNDVAFYRIYSSTGEMNYAIFTSSVSHPTETWTAESLIDGQSYNFVVRVVDIAGNEEENTNIVSATAFESLVGVKAVISIPQNGKKVSGQRLTVMAEISAGNVSNVKEILFQYKLVTSTNWLNITSANPNHPNPDSSSPYFAHWDVSGLTDKAQYNIQAVATDKNDIVDTSPSHITICIDCSDPDVEETKPSDAAHQKREKIENAKDNTIKIGDDDSNILTVITIPQGALDQDITRVKISVKPSTAPAYDKNLAFTGEIRKIELESGQKELSPNKEATLEIGYEDKDNDGIVDGSRVPEKEIAVYSYDENLMEWKKILFSSVDPKANIITAKVTHFSYFGLFGFFGNRLAEVLVYPNPFKPNEGHNKIIFSKLTGEDVTIKIFNIAGELVWEKQNIITASEEWLVVNKDDEPVASGIYIYLIADKVGNKTTGKLAIVR